jgi:hypothetical protein
MIKLIGDKNIIAVEFEQFQEDERWVIPRFGLAEIR